MSNKKMFALMAAFAAMSFFKAPLSLAQEAEPRPFTPKIKTPETSKELKKEDKTTPVADEVDEERPAPTTSAPRRLQQHGIGIGLGQTFLLGNYGKYGMDKITLDLLYSYAASYSFDLLVNAHLSEHEDESDRMRLMGLTTSIKGRFVEYDNFSPYFLGGLGFYAPKARRDGKWTKQKVTFGLNFGGGIDLRLNDEFVVGLMAQLHWPFAIEQEGQSDLRGYYGKLLITGMYLF